MSQFETDLKIHASLFGGLDHRTGVLECVGHGFLAQHGLARLERCKGQFTVRVVRRRDEHQFDTRVIQYLSQVGRRLNAQLSGDFADALFTHVHGDNGADLRALFEYVDFAGPVAAGANDSYAHLVLPAKVVIPGCRPLKGRRIMSPAGGAASSSLQVRDDVAPLRRLCDSQALALAAGFED